MGCSLFSFFSKMLSAGQGRFYGFASDGHTIVLTGQGGSGKSYVLQKFASEMERKGKTVSVTCSTGISATQFKNDQTLHRWCGTGDGGIEARELVRLICKDERYTQTRQRIKSCDIFIVDECSMTSKRIFETVDLVCRSVRENSRYFGGLQVIFWDIFTSCPQH